MPSISSFLTFDQMFATGSRRLLVGYRAQLRGLSLARWASGNPPRYPGVTALGSLLRSTTQLEELLIREGVEEYQALGLVSSTEKQYMNHYCIQSLHVSHI